MTKLDIASRSNESPVHTGMPNVMMLDYKHCRLFSTHGFSTQGLPELGKLIQIVLFGLCVGSSTVIGDDVRLNQIQTVGTHNSYHLAPPGEVLAVISLGSRRSAEALDYSHRPIHEQLETMKVRQFEFDLYADPDGGLFSSPIAYSPDKSSQEAGEQNPNAGGVLDKPGLKVLHSPDYDYRSTVPTFVDALRQIRSWSNANPQHIPILILVELKDSAVGPVQVKPVPFDAEQLDNVDREIRSVFAENQMILPDQLRAGYPTLRDAIRDKGWPKLSDCQGRVWFALDNGGALPTAYLQGHPALEGRVMFVSVGLDSPAAAFVKLNDPVEQFDEIQRAVRSGMIVRTRADAETMEARMNDTKRRDRAFESGAQYISTDYPVADSRLSDYQVCLPDSREYQLSPHKFSD